MLTILPLAFRNLENIDDFDEVLDTERISGQLIYCSCLDNKEFGKRSENINFGIMALMVCDKILSKQDIEDVFPLCSTKKLLLQNENVALLS